jgi:hypothetical protein
MGPSPLFPSALFVLNKLISEVKLLTKNQEAANIIIG